jgi:hypothetical protein
VKSKCVIIKNKKAMDFILNFLMLFVSFILATSQNQQSAPALLLTTHDSVSIVYPKEMGYEKDYLQVIYKVLGSSQTPPRKPAINRVEDAVYDSHAACAYVVISYANHAGSEIIRLKQNNNESIGTNSNEEQLAVYWSRSPFYKNTSTSVLNMDFNEKKRKLYWLEYNYLLNKWSIVIAHLNDDSKSDMEFHTFDNPRFSYDGYSFISVVYDEMETVIGNYHDAESPQVAINTQNTRKYKNRLLDTERKVHFRRKIGELVVFITNNQTLNICFLSNLTCKDFFQMEDRVPEGDYYDGVPRNQPDESKFGRLMGVQYEPKERAIYLADYGYDRIEKIYININTDYSIRNSQVKLSSISLSDIQTLVQASSGQMPINPIMSISYDNHIFWTDFEDGLKATVYKSPCIRPVYRVKNATTLKLIHIMSKRNSSTVVNSTLTKNRYLSSIQKNQFQYPPDYDFYYTTQTAQTDAAYALKVASDEKSKSSAGQHFAKAKIILTFSIFCFYSIS